MLLQAPTWSLVCVSKLKLPNEVGAVAAYDQQHLMAAVGQRLVCLKLVEGSLVKRCWAATRETCSAISTCPGRGLVATSDTQHSVTLWAVGYDGRDDISALQVGRLTQELIEVRSGVDMRLELYSQGLFSIMKRASAAFLSS